jgi:hypothetical protein
MWLMTYDTERKQYRRWEFGTLGGCIEQSGQWDETSQSFVFSEPHDDKERRITCIRFISPDAYQWVFGDNDARGDVYRRSK